MDFGGWFGRHRNLRMGKAQPPTFHHCYQQIFCAWPCLSTLKYVNELPDANDPDYKGEYLMHWTPEGDVLFKKQFMGLRMVINDCEHLYSHAEWKFIELRQRND